MELHLTDVGIIADGADLGWKMRRSVLAILSLRCLLDIQVEYQKGSGGPIVQFKGEIWAGGG